MKTTALEGKLTFGDPLLDSGVEGRGLSRYRFQAMLQGNALCPTWTVFPTFSPFVQVKADYEQALANVTDPAVTTLL